MTRVVITLSALCVALAILATYLMFKGNPWKARAVVAEQQATTNQTVANVNGRRAVNAAKAQVAERKAADAIEAAPDVESALAEFSAGIDGVRWEGHAPVDRTDDR